MGFNSFGQYRYRVRRTGHGHGSPSVEVTIRSTTSDTATAAELGTAYWNGSGTHVRAMVSTASDQPVSPIEGKHQPNGGFQTAFNDATPPFARS